MKVWILIVLVVGNFSNPDKTKMQTLEFGTEPACMAAAEWIAEEDKRLSVTCLPKIYWPETNTSEEKETFDLAAFKLDLDQVLKEVEFDMEGDTPYNHIGRNWNNGCKNCHK